ncbi:DUF456 domain-containing protein [Natrinema salinisoli]|uniref:DUF456 domain-containing protein n=1 Tax=Natrinema salinisoli TaxID=2878535 RepID=UPI001CF0C219|nr:DUF456 domain-containing protein [Natrinema salinisoli]
MSDRSDEVTETRDRDAPATDDLLEETERLLSDSDVDAGNRSPESVDGSTDRDGDSDLRDSSVGVDHRPADGPEPVADSDGETETGSSRSWLSPLTSRLSFGRYFSPKAFLALVGVLSASLLAGDTVLPIAGRMIGMFAAAFTVGLLASKRRYLEVGAAGVSVGGVAAVLNHVFIAAAGSGQRVVAVGATVGLLASLVGYYFGRDLRDGLSKDIE